MSIPSDCHIYLTVNQKDERMFLYTEKKHQYSYMRLLLAKCTPQGLNYVGGDFRQDQVLTIEANLQAGDYLVLVDIDWVQELYRELILSKFMQTSL